ncbi:hypothetical protein D9757_006697 [Collybiopsis confluens]|uniref:rRNA methyltransferase 2, mitochondrial n=1 Tax=Collybiopsis confluens TaxID=2823264 RepID=A0A8H5HNK7_9AGAR|nr:hypothetical protein D9757_006697 [Collybiopsis confluens]
MPLRLPFKPSSPCCSSKTKKSSTEWLRRQSQDPFVTQRAHGVKSPSKPGFLGSLGYSKDGTSASASSLSPFRSRSAFKLVEMHEKYDEFLTIPDVRVVVDLGAAPGGWSQVVSQLVYEPKRKFPKLPETQEVVEDDEVAELEPEWDLLDDRKAKRRANRKPKFQPKPASPPPEFYDPLNIDADLERLLTESSSGRKPKVTVIAVDKLPMDPIPGVSTLKADFLHPHTESMIRALLDNPFASFSPHSRTPSLPKLGLSNSDPPKVDVILSDIAPNMTGVPAVDSQTNLQAAEAVFQFVERYLRSAEDAGRTKAGVLVLKHFAHPMMDAFRRNVLEPCFQEVMFIKPKASRQESSEGYFLCRGYRPRYYL